MYIINIPDQDGLAFEYDPEKSRSNLEKHGIAFEEAKGLWKAVHVRAAAKKKGEPRYAVVGVLRGVHWTAIATDRNGRIRIISVRRSTDKERSSYERYKNNCR